MKARFWVVGKKQFSLRGALNDELSSDRHRSKDRSKYPVILKRHHKASKPGGWSKMHSRYADGAVNYRWNKDLKILECWAVTKEGNIPYRLIGQFIEIILGSQKRNVRNIHIEVE